MQQYFVTVQTCLTSIGYTRGLIVDTQRSQFYIVPTEVCEILNYKYGNEVNAIKSVFIDLKLLSEYFDFLVEKEIILLTPLNMYENFPELKREIRIPSIAEILIVNFSRANQKFIIPLIAKLNAKYLEIRGELIQLKAILSVVIELNRSTLHSIQILIKNPDSSDLGPFINLIEQIQSNSRVKMIVEGLNKTNVKDIQYDTDDVSISMNMVVNIKFFMESCFYNPYYHNKLYLNKDLQVYNTPKERIAFGHVHDILSENTTGLLNKFIHYLNVPNSKVVVCCDCEFKYSCLNSLERELNSRGELYNKTECNYNPYICKWQGEEGYKTLAECGVISNEHGFIIDHERIAVINKELWGEDE